MEKNSLWRWIGSHIRLASIALFVAADLLLLAALVRAEPGVLSVTFLDVGQGDAIFIEAPNGNQLLYDAGPPSGAALRELREVMPFWDRSIDVAVLSHPDMDHIGGFPEIFERYDIDLVFEPGARSENGVYGTVETSITNEGAGHLLARRGMRIELDDDAYADILYPDRDMSEMETNSASIVLRVVFGDTAFLLSGDLPKNIEDHIAGVDGARLHAQVLKLGHHGSRTSSSPYWLGAVEPEVAVISAGLDNRYGHPHKEVIESLAALNIPALKTFEEGNIVFISDGVVVRRK